MTTGLKLGTFMLAATNFSFRLEALSAPANFSKFRKEFYFIMSNELEVFNYNGNNVRTVIIDGNVWFVAKDICDVLDISNSRDAISELDNDEKNTVAINDGNRGNPNTSIISESGVYALVFKSRKPEAKNFSRWVRHEVLPAIRKNGVYMTREAQYEFITSPDFIIKLAQEIKKQREIAAQLQEKISQDRPKVIFAEAVDASDNSILVGNLAKILKQNGIDIGQNKLFIWLRENGYLMNCKGERWNMPTQKSMDKGLFEVKKIVVNNPDGSTKITHTTKVTGKGQIFFVNAFLAQEAV